MKFISLVLLFFYIEPIFAKVRIITFHYNEPAFIEFQFKLFQKFLLEDFEMVVFNDAKTEENEVAIKKTCEKFDIKHVRYNQEWHLSEPLNEEISSLVKDPNASLIWNWNENTTIEEIGAHGSIRHCHVIQYALNHSAYNHDDAVVLLDGDNLLIHPLSIHALLERADIVYSSRIEDIEGVARKQSRITLPQRNGLPSPIFMAFYPSKLPDIRSFKLDVGLLKNHPLKRDHSLHDTGAKLYDYLQKHPSIKTKELFKINSGIYREYFKNHDLSYYGMREEIILFIQDIYHKM